MPISQLHDLEKPRSEDTGRQFQPGPVLLCFCFLVFALLLISRRPDCVQNPQFWAEEGKRFYVEALERLAWTNVTTHSFGYFDLLLRLEHQIAALFPLTAAPHFLNFSAIALQALVPTFLLSRRSAGWLGPFPFRLATAFLYCGMPNSFETHCIELHSRVHLVILAVLILVGLPPLSRFGKILDVACLSLSGLSGPFALVLAPTALCRYWQIRTSDARRNLFPLGAALGLEIFALAFSGGERLAVSLGLSFQNLFRIIGGQFALGFFFGLASYTRLLKQPGFGLAVAAGCLLIVATFVLSIWRGSGEVRCLCMVGFGCLAIALAAPIGAPDRPQWLALWNIPGFGQRYYFIPMAMTLFALAAATHRGNDRWWQRAAICLLIIFTAMGVRLDWNLPKFVDLDFSSHAERYQSLPPGTSASIPINPAGWEMELHKPTSPER